MLYFFGFCLALALIALAVIDFKTFILPNVITFPLIAGGLIFGFFMADWKDAALGALIGYFGFLGLELAYKKLRNRDGLGRGDAKLLAAGGAWCGWFGLPFIILIASASGLVHALMVSVKSKDEPTELPFGPHLALGIFLTWLALFVLS
jgi:leader peptidase (prepilin peptidase)/N-methyltransferase